MRYRWLIIITFALFSVSSSERVYAQADTDRIIAGDHLAKLWDAIRAEKVTIKQVELNNQIVKRRLSAILIPRDQPQKTRIVRRCFKDKTIFDVPDLEISQEDYSQLIQYAKDGVFALVNAIRTGLMVNDAKGLEVAIAALNSEISSKSGDKEAERRFAGALLAEFEPSQPQLAIYVSAFREHVEKKSLSQLKYMKYFESSFAPRTPYSWGSNDFSTLDLWKVNPSTVEVITIDDKVFRKTWVGSTYILVYQGSSPAPRDPSGLGLSEDWFSGKRGGGEFKVAFAPQVNFKM